MLPTVGERLEIRERSPEESDRRRVEQVADLAIRPARASTRMGAFENDPGPVAGEDDIPVDRVEMSACPRAFQPRNEANMPNQKRSCQNTTYRRC
jgi:hypothetical protein